MKVTKIKWVDGTKYKVKDKDFDLLTCVQGSELVVLEATHKTGMYKNTNFVGMFTTHIFSMKHLLEGDIFEEVIEPVDFITAYEDCEKNNHVYKDEKNPLVKMYGYNGAVTIVDDKTYGNTTRISDKWIKQ